MSAKQVLGKDLMLFINGKAIALATSCKLGVSAESIDTQSKDSGVWNEKAVKKIGWNCSSENVFSADADINGYDALFALMIAAEPVDIAFGIPSNKDTEFPEGGWSLPVKPYTGKAIITSLEANGSDGDKATFSISMDGTGALKPGDMSAKPPISISNVKLTSIGPSEKTRVEISGCRLDEIKDIEVEVLYDEGGDTPQKMSFTVTTKESTLICGVLDFDTDYNTGYIARRVIIYGDSVKLYDK